MFNLKITVEILKFIKSNLIITTHSPLMHLSEITLPSSWSQFVPSSTLPKSYPWPVLAIKQPSLQESKMDNINILTSIKNTISSFLSFFLLFIYFCFLLLMFVNFMDNWIRFLLIINNINLLESDMPAFQECK